MNLPFEHYRDIIPDFDDFQESLKRPLPVHLRVNRLKVEPAVLVGLIRERGLHLEESVEGEEAFLLARDLESPGNLPEYFLGYVHPQALSSCLVTRALSPAPGASVLDMCAAPGGKTSHMAEFMGNTGIIVANELYSSRHIPLAHTLSRLGVLNTVVTAYQAQEFPFRQGFDYVLADVPCSGEGRFRSPGKPGGFKAGRGIPRLLETQRRIIHRGFDLLNPGGVMVYATCTYNPDENEGIVQDLLKDGKARLLPVDTGIRVEPGLTRWRKECYDQQLRNAVRIYPHRTDSVGFFMARIGRRG